MWFDTEFDNVFRRLSDRFFHGDDIGETPNGVQTQTYGPYYYGYQMTIGPDGKPQVKEWGNVRPASAISQTTPGARAPPVDEIFDEKESINAMSH